MGTWVAIEARSGEEAVVQCGIALAWAAIRQVEALLHPLRPGSDLRRLRDAPPGEWVGLHPWTAQVLRHAQRLHALTDGIFDPCTPDRPGMLADLELSSGSAPAGPCARARLPLAIDLGGIAKGFAVDCGLAALQGAGCDAGLVNAGGDLGVFGSPTPVLLRRPGGRFQPWLLSEAALAVSDRDAAEVPGEHRGYYLRRGAPRAQPRYAAVTAGDAMSADALTKCVLLCSPARARQVLQECGAEAL